ncbi:MAG: hypothetical protein IKS51_01710 [Erysipelotrichaceae bacterium]|nr:hypothetical protein [Erysipelotrichaceae bacterium]
MREKKTNITKYYNVLFPIWMLIWYPFLFILLIPANYLMDTFVLSFSLKDESIRKPFRRKHTWKICLMGFLADFIGSAFLFAVIMLTEGNNDLVNAICYDPFNNVLAFLIIVIAIALSAVVIYFGDLWILKKAGLDDVQAKRSALFMAILTAPYLFLFPTKLIYQ